MIQRERGTHGRIPSRSCRPWRAFAPASFAGVSEEARTDMRMPFGKFRGIEVEHLPGDYLVWLGWTARRGPLAHAAQAALARREGPRPRVPILAPDVRPLAREIISVGFRSLVHRHHPDHAGDERQMQRLNIAKAWLIE